ncbi:MAG: polyphenol oxidase family protein [Thermoanaerobaculia bacterium]
MQWSTLHTDELGRLVLAPEVPDGFGLFYTTLDYGGRLAGQDLESLQQFVAGRWGSGVVLATCTQVHGTAIARASAPLERWSELGECDALWSDREDVAIGIKIADCLPVTIVDAGHGVIVNLHSGWRGAAAGIVPRALEAVRSESSFSAGESRAWLGPSIRQCCFEVGEEVVSAFESRYGSVGEFVDLSRGERPHFDLAGLTRRVLMAEGVPGSVIFDSGLCSRCEGSMFHSYRRDGAKSGRVLAIAVRARISDQSAI